MAQYKSDETQEAGALAKVVTSSIAWSSLLLSAYGNCLDNGLANQHHHDQWPSIPKLTQVSLGHLFKNLTV